MLWATCPLEAFGSEGGPLRWGALHGMSLQVGGQGSSPVQGAGMLSAARIEGQLCGHDWL